MTTLQEALEKYLCREMPAGTIIGDPKWWAPKIAMAMRSALAQHGEQPSEPTDDQLVKGVKAMRLFVTKNSVADFKLGYMAALAAAPAPQAQEPVGINGLTEAETDACMSVRGLSQPAPQPAQGEHYQFVCANGCGMCGVKLTAFEYTRTESLAGDLLDSKTSPKLVSTCCGSEVDVYDAKADTHTDFQVIAQSAQPVAQPLKSSEIVTMYAEQPSCDADMIEFAREIERAHGIKDVK